MILYEIPEAVNAGKIDIFCKNAIFGISPARAVLF